MDIKFTTDNSFERIHATLMLADNVFSPPLSNRVDIETYSRKLSELACNIFITVDGVVAGHAAYYLNLIQESIYVSSIFIDEKFRRKGLMRKVIEFILEKEVEASCKKIILDVDLSNYVALLAYENLGFVVESRSSRSFTLVRCLS